MARFSAQIHYTKRKVPALRVFGALLVSDRVSFFISGDLVPIYPPRAVFQFAVSAGMNKPCLVVIDVSLLKRNVLERLGLKPNAFGMFHDKSGTMLPWESRALFPEITRLV